MKKTIAIFVIGLLLTFSAFGVSAQDNMMSKKNKMSKTKHHKMMKPKHRHHPRKMIKTMMKDNTMKETMMKKK